MRLLLVQHGDALPKERDPDRALSPRGHADVSRVGAWLHAAGIPVTRILHSGKTRARQTAEIVAACCERAPRIEAADGLAPADPVAPWARTLDSLGDDCMLVGHLPFMGRLAALLLAGDADADAVDFRPGSVLCLEGDDVSGWRVQWMLRPELLAR